MSSVAFVGAGRWALALALALHRRGHTVRLWEPEPRALARFLTDRHHPDLPPNHPIPIEITVTGEPAQALRQAEIIAFAVPSPSLAVTAESIKHLIPTGAAVLTVTKGVDPQSLRRLSLVLAERLGRPSVCVLAGPGIPYDFVCGDPTSLVAASENRTTAERVRDVFSGGTLRVYSHDDVVGVELGAAIKNVIAIAGGVCDGLELGMNAKAALLTRGLAEMIRLGLTLNANPMTFAGLSGMGDLIVTAFSPHSRNHELGRLIGTGLALDDARASLNGVAEGATTCQSIRAIAGRLTVQMPICEEVYQMLFCGVTPAESLERLARRRPRPEVWQ
jgi:glycerol-3-phosphate dehydrogenase (NAD(P)+)